MSQPPAPYNRSYSFTDFSESNPTTPHQGQKIDQELNNARTAINSTITRLGEIQADDGKVRTTALNLAVIAEEVEPLLTDAPVQAVEAAGAQQVAAVNDAGDAKVAELEAVLSSQNALDAIAARDAAQSAAYEADLSKISAANSAGLANTYANTALQAKNSAQVHAQVAVDAAASIPLIVGPVGPQGPQGIQGQQGLTGPVGPVGPVGQQGIQGPQGIQGINGDQYATTSTTTNIVGNGTKTFVVEQDLAYTTQQNVVVAFDAGNHMHGAVLGYDSSTGVIAIDVKSHSGNGTHSSWTINLEGAAGIQGPQGIQGIQGPAGVAGQTGATGPQGIQGDPGPAGNDGAQGQPGDQGPQGPQGSQGEQGPSVFTWRGYWDSSYYYNVNDVIVYNGSSYVAKTSNSSNAPWEGSYDWQLIAQRGNDGSAGSNGDQGPQGPEGPQGPQGANAFVWRGTYDYYTYYNQNDVVAYDGSSYLATTSQAYNYPYEGHPYWQLLARKGDTGNQGPQGESGSGGGGIGDANYDNIPYIRINNSWQPMSNYDQTGGGGGGSNPNYYHSVWAYNQWYNANISTVYDSNWNYVNVLTF